MIVLDRNGAPFADPDPSLGRLVPRSEKVTHRYVVDREEEGHWETVATYPNGGEDVEWRVDVAEEGHWETYREDGSEYEDYPGDVSGDWPHECEVPDVLEWYEWEPYTEDELAEIAETNAAAELAARRSEQVVTFARMAVAPMAATMTVSEGASVSTLWPERRVGDTVKLKDFFWYGGELYRCNQPELTITEGQTPDMNLPALYGHVSVAPDGILVWDADDLTGAPDIYNTGVEVHYPDADGPVYVSLRDGNTSEPTKDEWWEEGR